MPFRPMSTTGRKKSPLGNQSKKNMKKYIRPRILSHASSNDSIGLPMDLNLETDKRRDMI
jgi:hypothetical protein